jgi:iron(III) transport system permease protein
LALAARPAWRLGRWRPGLLETLAILAALAALAPLAGVVAAALAPGGAEAAIPLGDLIRYAWTSLALAALVAAATAILGTGAAWLVAAYEFPGRAVFAWALALPLAAPAFALAYAYADLFDVAGPVRTLARAHLGFDPGFRLRSLWGAAFVLSLAFYPYVYLAMRAAFVNQSDQALEAARTLGSPLREAFWRVALPMARPALAAGVALAVMETLADYGAVQFLAVQTLTTGVVRAWVVFGSMASAAQFAIPLLAAAALLLWIERRGRQGRSHDSAATRWRATTRAPLTGWSAVGATAFCTTLIGLGLILPMGWMAFGFSDFVPDWDRLIAAARNSLALALTGAAVTVALATALALGMARAPWLVRLASLGYATPGAVMAIGLLAPAALVWRYVPGAAQGFGMGLALMIYAYAARLMAAALEPIEAGLARLPPSLVKAARILGRSETGAALSVQVPLARGAVLTAALVVFIDILKELPGTLILRPFNFDTLAVIADNYARDERLAQAGWPSLLIVALAFPATIWVTRQVDHARPGSAA